MRVVVDREVSVLIRGLLSLKRNSSDICRFMFIKSTAVAGAIIVLLVGFTIQELDCIGALSFLIALERSS